MTTHISYKTAKAIKEFLGESAPEPMAGEYWKYSAAMVAVNIQRHIIPTEDDAPAYQLHDLLSKQFCEAMAEKTEYKCYKHEPYQISNRLHNCYWDGGLPAVERALTEMMEGK